MLILTYLRRDIIIMFVSRVELGLHVKCLIQDCRKWLRVSGRIDGSVARQPRSVIRASRLVSRIALSPDSFCSSIRRQTCVAELEAA